MSHEVKCFLHLFFISCFVNQCCFFLLPTEHAGNTTTINGVDDFVHISFPTSFLRWTSYCVVMLEEKIVSVYEDASLLDTLELKHDAILPSNDYVILGQSLKRESKMSLAGDLADLQMWTEALTADKVRMVAACEPLIVAPQVFLNRDQWIVNGAAIWITNEGLNNVCQLKPYSGQNWVILKEDLRDNGLELCRTLGGRLPTPRDKVSNTLLEEFVLSHHTAIEGIYLGINRSKTGWIDAYNGQPITYWPNRSLIQSEVADVCLNPIQGTWVERANTVCLVVCETPVRKVFLKGLCAASAFTKELWIDHSTSGRLVMREAGTFILQPNEQGDGWSLTSSAHKRTWAEVQPKTSELPFGPQDWRVWDKECGYRGEEIPLMLTTCSRNMFTCGDLSCIPTNKRCNKIADCSDGSDEDCAKKVEIPIDYNKLIPPKQSPSSPFTMNCRLDIINFKSFSIKEMAWVIDFYLIMEWRDSRLKYLHLNNYQEARMQEMEKFWTPAYDITSSLGLATTTDVIYRNLAAASDGGPSEPDDLSTFHGGNV